MLVIQAFQAAIVDWMADLVVVDSVAIVEEPAVVEPVVADFAGKLAVVAGPAAVGPVGAAAEAPVAFLLALEGARSFSKCSRSDRW